MGTASAPYSGLSVTRRKAAKFGVLHDRHLVSPLVGRPDDAGELGADPGDPDAIGPRIGRYPAAKAGTYRSW